jgi:hypothetical protein
MLLTEFINEVMVIIRGVFTPMEVIENGYKEKVRGNLPRGGNK